MKVIQASLLCPGASKTNLTPVSKTRRKKDAIWGILSLSCLPVFTGMAIVNQGLEC
jgi:hypothetical protein